MTFLSLILFYPCVRFHVYVDSHFIIHIKFYFLCSYNMPRGKLSGSVFTIFRYCVFAGCLSRNIVFPKGFKVSRCPETLFSSGFYGFGKPCKTRSRASGDTMGACATARKLLIFLRFPLVLRPTWTGSLTTSSSNSFLTNMKSFILPRFTRV